MNTVRFSDVKGQEEAKRRLRMTVDSGKLPHALMLTGPSGLGKMLLARAFMALTARTRTTASLAAIAATAVSMPTSTIPTFTSRSQS